MFKDVNEIKNENSNLLDKKEFFTGKLICAPYSPVEYYEITEATNNTINRIDDCKQIYRLL